MVETVLKSELQALGISQNKASEAANINRGRFSLLVNRKINPNPKNPFRWSLLNKLLNQKRLL